MSSATAQIAAVSAKVSALRKKLLERFVNQHAMILRGKYAGRDGRITDVWFINDDIRLLIRPFRLDNGYDPTDSHPDCLAEHTCYYLRVEEFQLLNEKSAPPVHTATKLMEEHLENG